MNKYLAMGLIFGTGVMTGIFVGKRLQTNKIANIGNIRIDNSDGEQRLFLEVTSLDNLNRASIGNVKIIRENYIRK